MKVILNLPVARFLFLFVTLFILSIAANAQVTDFQMQDYLYRTPGMRALNFTTNGNISGTSKLNNLAYGIMPSTAYNKQYSSDTRQYSMWNFNNLGVSRVPNFSPIPLPNLPETRNNQLYLSTSFYWTSRNYSGNKFFEYGSNSFVSMGNPSLKSDSRILNHVGLNPTVGVGIGRLEYVSNAQMALFILEDLQESGKIKGKVSEEKANKFTELITELYNTRIFDFRKRRNYECARIDSFLRANKLVTATDISVYNIIADNWNYSIQPRAIEASSFFSGSLQVPYSPVSDRINRFGILDQPSRFSGTRTSLLVTLPSNRSNTTLGDPSYASTIGFLNIGMSSATELDSTKKNFINTQTGHKTQLIWEKHSPKSLHVQEVISASASFLGLTDAKRYVFIADVPDSNYNINSNQLALNGSYMYSWFPNSRTIFTAHSALSYNYLKTKVNNYSSPGVSSILFAINLRTSYFLNYSSRIGATFTLSTIPWASNGNGPTNFAFTISYLNFIF